MEGRGFFGGFFAHAKNTLECLWRNDKPTPVFSKLDLCEGGSFSPTTSRSDIELSVFPHFVFYMFVLLSLCRRQRMCRKFGHCFCLVDIKKQNTQEVKKKERYLIKTRC